MPGNPIYLGEIFFSGGLATVVNGSDLVQGSIDFVAATAPIWTSATMPGDTFSIGSTRHYIKEVIDDDTIRLTEPWSGPSAGPTAYSGVRSPWHLDGRSIGYLIHQFLESDESSEASQIAVQARNEAVTARTDAINARDIAQAWANRPAGQDVTTPGTRSSLHYAFNSGISAVAADAARGASVSAQALSEAAATVAQAWASKAFGLDVAGPGTRSALHYATLTATDRAATAADAATAVAAKNDGEAASSLAEEWSSRPYGQAVTGTVNGRSALHHATDAANSAATAAALVHAAVNTIDYGLISDLPTDFADYGTIA